MSITAKQIKEAWQKCEDAWQAAGAPLPCLEENYMKARKEYASILNAALAQRPEQEFCKLQVGSSNLSSGSK